MLTPAEQNIGSGCTARRKEGKRGNEKRGKGEKGEGGVQLIVQRIKTIREKGLFPLYGSGQWGISQERGSKISEGIVGWRWGNGFFNGVE